MSARNKSILKKFDDLHEKIGSEEFFDIFCSLREEATDAVTISEFSKSLLVHHALDDEVSYFSVFSKSEFRNPDLENRYKTNYIPSFEGNDANEDIAVAA